MFGRGAVRGMDPDVVIAFRIGNFAHLRSAYGDRAAFGAVEVVRNAIADIVQRDGAVLTSGEGELEVRLSDDARFEDASALAACRAWVQSACATLPLTPIGTAAGKVHFTLSGRCAAGRGEGARHEPERGSYFPFLGGEAGGTAGWADRYREDMELVSHALAALTSPGASGGDGAAMLSIFWRPSRGDDGRDGPLYYEALGKVVRGDGVVQSPSALARSMERLGFAALFDRHMMRCVVTELEDWPDVTLAVALSGASARGDVWWGDITSRLARRRDVARRLIIAITNAVPITDMAETMRFVGEMRALGCKIMVSGFGAGFASIRQLLALSPDLVKIDPLFLRRATLSTRDRALFRHIADLAGAVAPIVVADGVDTEAQAEIVAEAGVSWRQGRYLGAASAGRPWLYGGGINGGNLDRALAQPNPASLAHAGQGSVH